MSYWKDGTSNQIIVGEKHIHARFVGECGDYAGAANFGRWRIQDCSQLISGTWSAVSVARSLHGYIARGPSDGPADNWTGEGDAREPAWGSNHPGVVHFLVGDGAVRSFAITTPSGPLFPARVAPDHWPHDDEILRGVGLSNSITGRLGRVDDGNPVTLP